MTGHAYPLAAEWPKPGERLRRKDHKLPNPFPTVRWTTGPDGEPVATTRCEGCGALASRGDHHHDYGPWGVRWLCDECLGRDLERRDD